MSLSKILRVCLLSLLFWGGLGWGSAYADNIVTIGTASGVPGKEVTLSIALQNTDDIAALQLLIPLDEELSLVEGSAAVTTRASGHSVTAGMKDGELSLMVYSLGMTSFTGTEGEVATVRLKLGNQPKDITLTASKLILTDSEGNSVSGTTQNGQVSIRCAKAQYSTTTIDFGRVPIRSTYQRTLTVRNVGNEPLEVSGLQFANYVTKFSSSTQFPLTVAAGGSANINITYAPEERGSVSETVKVLCNSISKLNTITLTAEPFAVNELHVQPASGIADETVTVSLAMNNMDAISGFQFEFNLPNALEFVPNSFQLSGRKQDHAVVQSVTDGLLRIICYSPTDKPFTGEEGELATMQFVLRGRYGVTLEPSKCLLTATIKNQVTNVCSAYEGGHIDISSPQLGAGSELDMGTTPVTEDAVQTFWVSNYGSAPLVINRVVFDQEGFSVRESLPVTIEAWSNKALTIVYQSKTEGDYETTMQLYCNDPEQRVWNVKVTGNRFAPNYLSFSAADISQGDPLAVEVALSNYDAINGIQFDVEYPADYFEPTDELTTTARAAGLSVSQRIISKGVARYFFYSLTDASIEPGEGKVLTMMFAPKAEVPEGSYQLKVTNVKLGTPDLVDKYAGQDVTCTFNVKQLMVGDVNCDGLITIADVTALVNIILGKDSVEPYQYDHRAADVNKDGSITIADVTALVNIILGKN